MGLSRQSAGGRCVPLLKTRTWIILIAVLALVLIALSVVLLTARSGGTRVQIIQDGTVLREIDLSRVKEPYSFTVEAPDGGYNRVEVEPGRIRVVEADCPDGICISQGWLSDQTVPIVCLPHRLIIKIKN